MATIDWTASMQQTYEYYIVDPNTWKDDRLLENIKSCTIDRDSDSSTLGSATLECTDSLDECYVRIYLKAIQNGLTFKEPLGTFLVQTPTKSFDGRKQSVSADAYTPLIELKEKPPDLGYTIFKTNEIMDIASRLCKENVRAPVVETTSDDKLEDDFVSNVDDTWLTFLTDLILNANYTFALDELGQILFAPIQDIAALQSIWEFNDDNSSIIYPDIEDEQDLYNVPNVVEVIYSADGISYISSRVVNDDTNSPISTVNRGREIIYRESDPSVLGSPTQQYIDEYAISLLKSLSNIDHTVTFKHGYCGVRLGDCVMLNYSRAGLNMVKAKITSQSISCVTGCPVETTAVYTTNLWRQ